MLKISKSGCLPGGAVLGQSVSLYLAKIWIWAKNMFLLWDPAFVKGAFVTLDIGSVWAFDRPSHS